MSELHRAVALPIDPGAAGSGDYYEKAAQCERDAAAAPSERMRQLFVEMAEQWCRLGDHLAGGEKSTSPPSSRTDGQIAKARVSPTFVRISHVP